MKLCVTIEVAGTPDAVLEYLHSDDYLNAAASVEGVLRAEVEERSEDDNRLMVATRWYAPTKLPKLLKKYEGKAPQSVNWLERMDWDVATYTASLTVQPDVPESWRSMYASSGEVTLEPTATGTKLMQQMEFTMSFGLIGKALEKLLKNEIEALLQQRLEVLRQHFG